MNCLNVLSFDDVSNKELKGPSAIAPKYEPKYGCLVNYVITGQIVGHSNIFQRANMIIVNIYHGSDKIEARFILKGGVKGGPSYGKHDEVLIYEMIGQYRFESHVVQPNNIKIEYVNLDSTSSYKYTATLEISNNQHLLPML